MGSVELFQTLQAHNSDVMSCDFSGNYLATCSGDKTVRVWIHNSKEFEECVFSPLIDHTYGVNCVRFSPFGTILASCSTDGRAILWNIQDGDKIGEVKHCNESPLRVCAFSPTSAIFATGGDDESIVIWDIATKSIIRILEGHQSMITSLVFSPDSAFLLSCCTAGDIMIWDALYGHGKCLSSVTNAHDLGILGCDFSTQYEAISENGFFSGSYTIATCGNDDLVKIWNVQTGSSANISLNIVLEGHTGNVMSCRFSLDGKRLVSVGGDRIIYIWSAETGHILQKLDGHTRYITCCAFSNSSFLATGSNDKTVMIWNLNKAEVSAYLPFHTPLSYSTKKRMYLSWSVDDVIKWLDSVKLSEFATTFQNNSIDGKELACLNHENLQTFLKIASFGHRNKILHEIQCLQNPLWQHAVRNSEDNLVLTEFRCPITHEIMKQPVVAADGYSYEERAIKEWIESGKNTSPMTNKEFDHKYLTPNHILSQLIRKLEI